MTRLLPAAFACLLSSTALADAPRVLTDIAPVHSLVARVMDGVGTPELLVSSGQSPHAAALRPSQARALQGADLVVWIGPELTPWLEKPLSTLAEGVTQLELLEAAGTAVRRYRDPGEAGHEDHEEHDGHAGLGHDNHADHAEGEEHRHDHSGTDPHAWLDPANAAAWLSGIAEHLAAKDADNAADYRANAEAAMKELAALTADLDTRLAPAKGRKVATFHDGYQYFEARFGILSAGALALGDASSPSPARVAALRDTLAHDDIACVFTEPQFDTRLLEAAAEGSPVRIAVLDPLGAHLEPGPGLYPRLLTAMAESISACLAP
ncbi:MAG: zinc ABC transporter substrate-binding protein [Pseudooceanicola sp.]|nr:zinc ABC transporter substrate-binding protein [Pseudooceanicola sp.]